MGGDFCDWQPCNHLKKFIAQKLTDGARDGSISTTILTRSERVPVMKVVFWYCPFCGTRLHNNKDVIEWVQGQRRA